MTQYHVGSLQDCYDLCGATGGPALACFSFTYRPSHSVCVIHVRRLAAAHWPPTSIPATRKMADGYISAPTSTSAPADDPDSIPFAVAKRQLFGARHESAKGRGQPARCCSAVQLFGSRWALSPSLG
ncbi:hypothetical protein DIPPA_26754 [Diplonema papillatum]|nr:hypothetical protein DIPPA_26754 [Diplonema papillatum]